LSKRNIYTPDGVRDILNDECYAKRNLEQKIRELFRKGGYRELETSSIEFYDVFSNDIGLVSQESMFKFFDQQGRILVLKPDATIPAARVAATKYSLQDFPLRLSYIGNTFRYNESGGGKQREFTVAGVEIMGVAAPDADAEVIAMAAETIRCGGLENFQIDIGQINFFKGLMEESGLPEADIENLRILIDRKDFIGIEELVRAHRLDSDISKLILSLPKPIGNIDTLDRIQSMTRNAKSLEALENLHQVLDILDDYGLSKYISIDLGMVYDMTFYTGIIFKGYTYDLGFPILRGGRYDSLVGKFGRDMPATGFSLGVNMLMTAMEKQGLLTEKITIDTAVTYTTEGRKTAFQLCSELRKQGLVVEMDINNCSTEDFKKYAVSRGIGGFLNILDENRIEVHNVKTGEVVLTTIDSLLENGGVGRKS